MKHVFRALFTLTLFSVIDRVIGFAFRYYLNEQIGAVNIGIYQIALSAFFLLLTFTTSGIPLIVSKLTASYRAKKNLQSEYSTVTSAIIIGASTALLICGIVLIFNKPLGGLFATRDSMMLLLILLPAIFFSSIYAAFRGNLWGRQKYTAVSVIELLEQVARVTMCVILFNIGTNKLKATAYSLSIACFISMAVCIITYFAYKGKLASPKGHIVPLLKTSTPITMIRASNSLVNMLIGLTVPFLLCYQGMSKTAALYIYGSTVGMAMPLLFIPLTVIGSLAYIMIPTLSTAMSNKDYKSANNQIENAISFSVIIAALFVPVFLALGKPLGILIFDNELSGQFLANSALLLIPLAVESITSSMMNSLDLEKQSFINYLIGAAAQFAFMFCFIKNFNINILCMALGLGWVLSSILHIRSIKKKTGISLKFALSFLKAGALIVPTTFLIKSLYTLMGNVSLVISIPTCAILGIGFMIVLCIIFGVLDFSAFVKNKKTKTDGMVTLIAK